MGMVPDLYGFVLAAADFATIAILIVVATVLAAAALGVTLVFGPKKPGPVKDATYESGMTPVMDARRRFNARFYLVAVVALVFGVEVVFLYPWAVVFPLQRTALSTVASPGGGVSGSSDAPAADLARWAHGLAENGYGPGYMLAVILVFFALLAVGFIYEWRKGAFKWD